MKKISFVNQILPHTVRKFPAPEDMDVKVKDNLPPFPVAIDHNSKSFLIHTLYPGYFIGGK